MKKIFSYLKPHRGALTYTLFVKFLASMMDLFIPFILAIILDDIVPQRKPSLIYLWGGGMALCAILSITLNIYANRMAAATSGKVTRKLRHDLFKKLGDTSMAQFDRVSLSSAVSRLTTDTYNINQFLNRTQRMGARAPILLIGGLILTSILDIRLTLVLALTLPIITLIIFFVTRYSVPLYDKQQTVLDKMVRVMQENIVGVRVIKALSKTPYEQRRFDGVNQQLSEVARKAGGVVALSNPLSSLTLNLGLTAVVLTGAYLVNAGLSRPGSIIAFMNYFTIISNAMMGITRIFIMSSKGIASARRIEEVLDLPEDQPLLLAEAEDSPWHIEFDHVSFSYNGVEDNLTDISFRLKQGQTLGIIGATGSGKTTLTNLLLRLYDPSSGRVLLNGRDLRSIPREELSAQVGVAFQSDFMMAATIRENIAYFRDIAESDLMDAIKSAQAEDFIMATKDALNHQVESRGNNLSGGQKQRLLIARALANKPSLLILDDASSALDYRTDAGLRRALSHHHSGTTSVIIAQRVSSIKGADLILVLDDGKVIGQGNHEHLMAACPPYREIADIQMSAFDGMNGEENGVSA
ncbi:MAG: ABC transporter ATP-binding protein [Clostridiales bacterium]|jgi:ATP-binding cassette subfamily B protein|nr:ABC transporter ATP-binding protein [Clostridiales bacterium]